MESRSLHCYGLLLFRPYVYPLVNDTVIVFFISDNGSRAIIYQAFESNMKPHTSVSLDLK